jgi:ribosomal protein L37AE/L43A
MPIAEKDRLDPFREWQFMKPGPRICPECKNGFIVSTKRFNENVFVDKCSNCGKVFAEYKVDPR